MSKAITLPSGTVVRYLVSHGQLLTDGVLTDKANRPLLIKAGTRYTTAKLKQITGTGDAGIVLGTGIALTHDGDQFKRHTGTKISLSRALRTSGLDKADRKAFWSQVWNGKYDAPTRSSYSVSNLELHLPTMSMEEAIDLRQYLDNNVGASSSNPTINRIYHALAEFTSSVALKQ